MSGKFWTGTRLKFSFGSILSNTWLNKAILPIFASLLLGECGGEADGFRLLTILFWNWGCRWTSVFWKGLPPPALAALTSLPYRNLMSGNNKTTSRSLDEPRASLSLELSLAVMCEWAGVHSSSCGTSWTSSVESRWYTLSLEFWISSSERSKGSLIWLPCSALKSVAVDVIVEALVILIFCFLLFLVLRITLHALVIISSLHYQCHC